jgi:hypothetical protein
VLTQHVIALIKLSTYCAFISTLNDCAEKQAAMGDGIMSRMMAVQRARRNKSACRDISQQLDIECRIIGCKFSKAAEYMVEMYPETWFAFNAGKVLKRPIYGVIESKEQLEGYLKRRKDGKETA